MALGRGEALEIAEGVLEESPADQTEVLLVGGRTALTRYANSAIHQNVSTEDRSVVLRLVFGKRIGITRTNQVDRASLKEAVARAAKIARAQRPNKDFVSLPEGGTPPVVASFASRTAASTPEERAEVVKDVVSTVQALGADKAFGSLEATTNSVTVANSLGVRAHDELTLGHLTVTAIKERDGEAGYGWGEELHTDIALLDHETAAMLAAEKASRSLGAKALEPGEYAVVLEDYAVAGIIQFLTYLSFGALPYREGRSCVSGSLGETVAGENITLWDEGAREEGMPLAFDAEGVPKERVSLLREGVADGVVYDSYEAGREGRRSTGHALPPPNTLGPLAVNPFLATGDAGLEEMVAETKRGLYVTRLHYVNPVDPKKAVITGMTRDGTFLIEDGELAGAVRNLRFTQGLLEALREVPLLGSEARPHRYSTWLGLGATTVPSMKVERFRFTGATEF